MADEEEIIEETGAEGDGKAGALLGPEGVVMMMVAVPLDFIGFVLTVINILTMAGVFALQIPEIVNWLSDGAGLVFFGLWMMFRMPSLSEDSDSAELTQAVAQKRTEQKESLRGFKKNVAKAGGKRGLRFGLVILGEILPFIGALPFWTWFVYSELKR